MRNVFLECPSGIAGNLFASALFACGAPQELFVSIPQILDLHPGFSVEMENGVLDGYWNPEVPEKSTGGPVSVMPKMAAEALGGRAGHLAQEILQCRWSKDCVTQVHGEAWCDTLFDACAAALGLEYLGWPEITVMGALPTSSTENPVAREILKSWIWRPADFDVELVTPTGAAILQTYCHQTTQNCSDLGLIGLIRGNFCQKYDLPSMSVYTD